MMNYAVIKGTNQKGQSVTWEGPARWQGNYWSTYVFASGWWWVGNVRIYWRGPNGVWNSNVYYVPKQQTGDIVYFSCPLN